MVVYPGYQVRHCPLSSPRCEVGKRPDLLVPVYCFYHPITMPSTQFQLHEAIFSPINDTFV